MARVGVLFITAAFFVTVALITGTVQHVSPSQNLEIRTWHDLNAVRNNLDSNYTLMNDLDSTTAGYEELASPSANGGKGWQPIGTYQPWAATTITGFMGTFDGQGHQIRDLFINRPDELGAGLFGEVGREGVIKGIRVVNANVTGDGFVGLFAVVDEGGRIEDISVVNGTVTGEAFVGGLVGDNFYGVVSNSHFTGSVNGNHIVGGLVGSNSYGTVSDSYSTARVTGNYTVGGLVGLNYGHVSNSYSTGGVSGHASVGGLVAENEGEGTISNSFWDTETSGQAISAGGTGKTTAEMQDIATFSGAGWEICAVPPAATNPAYIWNIVDHETYPFLSCYPVSVSQDQEHIPPTQIKTETIPLGYFELTVSPAGVYASVGEQIEIRCTMDTPLVNTPIEISSVDVVLFDCHDSIIREQAMTTWDPQDGHHYLSADTVYTIVGDEAYYKLKVNYGLLSGVGESGELTFAGEYTEHTAYSFPIVVSQDKEPIEIVSVMGPVGPVNPRGPGVKITMKNVGLEPVVSLAATLEVGGSYDFTFDVTPSNPLEANKSTSRTLTLIGGGGFSSDGWYPLTINATLQNGANFVYTKLVQIEQPRPSI